MKSKSIPLEFIIFKKYMFSKYLSQCLSFILLLYQVALVKWTESVGLALVKRDLNTMTLRTPNNKHVTYTILQIFPFTSETKRMGIIVKVSNLTPSYLILYLYSFICAGNENRLMHLMDPICYEWELTRQIGKL